jgi:hypothetical protein
MPEQKPTPDKPRLILTHGEKGGVGKTTVARVLADYYKAQDVPFRAYDAEGETGQLLRFHGEQTSPVEITKAALIAPVLDYLMDTTGKRLALVDLGARTGPDLQGWLYRGGALEEARDGNLAITVAYVLGGAIDSVGHLKESYNELGNDVHYIVVRNLGVASKLLDPAVYQSVDKASVSFQDFADNKGGNFSYTERRYCRTWLRECFAAFEEVAGMLR